MTKKEFTEYIREQIRAEWESEWESEWDNETRIRKHNKKQG
jgi:hypothetical protein